LNTIGKFTANYWLDLSKLKYYDHYSKSIGDKVKGHFEKAMGNKTTRLLGS